MRDCNPVHTPMKTGMNLARSENEEETDATNFIKMVGVFVTYLICDLTYHIV